MKPRELIQAVGGPTRLARALKRSHTAVILWKEIPPHHVIAIESKFGIPREQLRPDLYPPRRPTRRNHPTPTQHQKETRV
ncbi:MULTISPECIES: YdaS family helix-turn-helix protein [unclassified Saccharibacter]|uniref:YdaS family helix-turn-helix protein n=1 Tax=unclassified Saccharibacter TaxID=2648722 RepID=UPI0013224503|nr:hypothetical protein [Saccharibacter sp. EH611]MXV57911.1 hypothetical protein [Saccharibacter sp. EH70]MXV66306.1 hypothetical protein [Saccharibacter sp. EH60]